MAQRQNRRRRGEVSAEDKKPISRTGLQKAFSIFKFIYPYKGYFLSGMVFLLLSTLTTLAFPYFVGDLADIATKGFFLSEGNAEGMTEADVKQLLNRNALILALILLTQGIFSFARIYLFAQVSVRGMADIRYTLYQKMLSLPLVFFEKRRVGELTSRISSDITQLNDMLSFTLAEFLRNILTLGGGIVILLLMVSTQLSLFMVFTFIPMVIISILFGRVIRKYSRNAQDELAESNVIVEETLQAINVVKAFTNEMFEVLRYRKRLDSVIVHSLKAATFRGLFATVIIIALLGGIVLVLWYGVSMVSEHNLSIGALLKFIIYTSFIGGAVGGISSLYGELQKTIGASERVLEILDEEGEFGEAAKEEETRLAGDIMFKEVEFAYPTRLDVTVLENVSLTVRSGQKIALVGPSGAGKSTIAQLLLRFYPIQGGTLSVDGKDIFSYDLHQLRNQMGIVPQEVILFGGSIRENIAYGNPKATEEEILDAAKKANAYEFIMGFPEKFDTIVGDRGIRLSGGQRQRIAIARAILKNPAILILDEATSSLDAESEHLVQEALNALMKGRTTIIIAHRLSTIRDVDCIYVIDQGQIMEAGRHEELVTHKDGIYNNLLRLQLEAGQLKS